MSLAPERVRTPSHRRDWLPMALIVLAVLLLAAYQTVGLVREHDALARVYTAQQPTIDQAQKMRTALQTIATKTAQLAANGDTTARDVLDSMHRAGVTVSLPADKK